MSENVALGKATVQGPVVRIRSVSETAPIRIKVFGERNTGTNFIIQLLEKNVDADVLAGTDPRLNNLLFRLPRSMLRRCLPPTLYRRLIERDVDQKFADDFDDLLGWKHALISEDMLARFETMQDVVFLCVVKNPYAWVLSMYRRPYHRVRKPASLQAFITTPWLTVAREMAATESFADLIEMWNAKTRSYLALRDRCRCLIVRYEDVLDDYARAVRTITTELGVSCRFERIENVPWSTKGERRSFGAYRQYYLDERWRSKLDPSCVAMINERIDKELVEELGYRVL